MNILVLGARGHAKVVITTIRAEGRHEIAGILDDDASLEGQAVLGVRVLGPIAPEAIARLGVRHALVAVGSNQARADIVQRLARQVEWPTIVHPHASVAEDVAPGEGTIVLAGVVIQPDTVVGRHVILNTGCSVDHDCVVEDFAHVAPGARVAGHCRIGTGSLLGIGCAVIPGRTIGPRAIIGAGAAVVSDVPPGVVAMGVPARWR